MPDPGATEAEASSELTPTPLKQIRVDVAITNRTTDPRKRAAELTEEFLRSEMRRGSILNPLNWGRKAGLRIMEEYWRQRLIKQVETSMLENNNSLLTLDMAKSSIRARDLFRGNLQNVNLDTNANRARAQAEGQDTNKQLRLSAQEGTLISGQRVEEAQGTLRDMMVSEIIRPLVEGRITEAQIQDKLREFVRTHQNDPQVLAIFGPDANQYGRIATYFATDLKEAAQVIKDDIAAHKYAIEQLNEVVRIQLANTDWAAETEAKFNRADRAIAWAEKHRLSGLLANPAVIGAAFSLATFATMRATGVAATASQWIIPGAGLLPAAAFAAFRRNYDLKVDRASHQVERAYNKQIPPDAPRREALERHAYNTASVDIMINGGGQELVGGSTRLSVTELLTADLSVASNQEALIRRTTEMKSRLDFSAEQSIDLVTFESRGQVSQGRLQLIEAIAKAHIALRNASVADDVISREEGRLTGEWRARFMENREQQDRAFNHYKLGQSIKAGIFGGAVGLAGSFVTQEVWAGIGRGVFHQQIGNTVLENAFSGKPINEWLSGGRAPGFAIDQAKELYQHPGNLKISDNITLAIDTNHSGSLIDTATGNKIPTPPLNLTENGQLVFSGKMDNLPSQVRDLVGTWENRVNTNPTFNLQEHLKAAAVAPDGSGHETFQHGDWVVDVNSGPNHQMSMTHWPTQTQIHGFIGPNGALDIDSNFGGNSSVAPGEWEDMQKLLQSNGWATSSETVPGQSLFGPEGKWKNFSTTVDHREWYSYDQPGSQGNELGLHDTKVGNSVTLDISHMQQGFQRGLNPNPINVQEVIKNREGGWYFTTPDLPQDGIWVSDGADGVWDGKLALDPNDLNPTHVIQTSNGPLQLGEFSKMVLNQDALQKYPDGNLATEVYGRQDVFNLGQDGKNGFIEAGRIINKDGVNVLQDFATIRGISEMPPTPPKEIFTFEPPIATEFTPPLPTELEPPPLIPIPFAPRFPLEPLWIPPDRSTIPRDGYYYWRDFLSPESRAFYEARRSPRLRENPHANLDASVEIPDYFRRQSPEYMNELEGYLRQPEMSEPMDENCDVVVCIPVYDLGEGKIIENTLNQYLSQIDGSTNQQAIDSSKYEIILFLNHPKNPSERNRNGNRTVLEQRLGHPYLEGAEERVRSGNPEQYDTEEVIRQFKEKHPELRIRIMKKEFETRPLWGNIIKPLYDAGLLRAMRRKNPYRRDPLIITNDADVVHMSPTYLRDILQEMDLNEIAGWRDPSVRKLDGLVGNTDMVKEGYQEAPGFLLAQRLFNFLELQNRGNHSTQGRNTIVRGSTYAAIGGANNETNAGADGELGTMINLARDNNDPRHPYIHKAWLQTDPRREYDSWRQGIPLVANWYDWDTRNVYGQNWEERFKESGENNPHDIKTSIEREVNAYVDIGWWGNMHSPYMQRALAFMGLRNHQANLDRVLYSGIEISSPQMQKLLHSLNLSSGDYHIEKTNIGGQMRDRIVIDKKEGHMDYHFVKRKNDKGEEKEYLAIDNISQVERKLQRFMDDKRWKVTAGKINSAKNHPPGSMVTDKFYAEYIDYEEFDGIYGEIFISHDYPWRPDLTANPKPKVIDLGGHIGMSVLYWKSLAPDADITVVEANPNTSKVLKRNIGRNHLKDIKVIEGAASSKDGNVDLYQPKPGVDFRWGDFVRGEPADPTKYDKLSVPSVKLSTLISGPTDLLKIDIEGSELEVLREAESKLPQVKEIMMEFHIDPANPANSLPETLALLNRQGFKTEVRLLGKPVDVTNLDTTQKIFLTILAHRGTQPRRQTLQQSTPEQTRATPGSIAELANNVLSQTTNDQVSIETTPQFIAQAMQSRLESFIRTTNLGYPGTKLAVKIQGNRVVVEGNISSLEGTARFRGEFVPDQNGRLIANTPSFHVPDKMASKLGNRLDTELKRQVDALTTRLPSELVTQQVDPAWEIAGSHVEGGKLVLDFTKKGGITPAATPDAALSEAQAVSTATTEQAPPTSQRTGSPIPKRVQQIFDRLRSEGADLDRQIESPAILELVEEDTARLQNITLAEIGNLDSPDLQAAYQAFYDTKEKLQKQVNTVATQSVTENSTPHLEDVATLVDNLIENNVGIARYHRPSLSEEELVREVTQRLNRSLELSAQIAEQKPSATRPTQETSPVAVQTTDTLPSAAPELSEGDKKLADKFWQGIQPEERLRSRDNLIRRIERGLAKGTLDYFGTGNGVVSSPQDLSEYDKELMAALKQIGQELGCTVEDFYFNPDIKAMQAVIRKVK